MSPTVLLVNDLAAVGGAQTAMLDIVRILRGAGFRTHLASPAGDLADRSMALGAHWHDFGYAERRLLTPRLRVPRPLAVAARLSEGRRLAVLAAEVEADVVHTGALIPHLDAAVARVRARTLWHLNQLHPRYLFAGPLPDRIIGVSDAALRPAKWRSRAVRRSAIVRNGVDVRRFRPPSVAERAQVRDALGLGDVFAILTVARLEPLKGVETLIRSAARCDTKTVLVVVGDAGGFSGGSAYADGIGVLAKDLDVDVRFLGARSDVPELMWAADLFAFGTRWDAAPLVLCEASASGLAVVTSNIGGCPELVADGDTGLLVPPGDVKGFASAFDRLATDGALRCRLAEAGRRRAVETFDVADLGARLLPHYLHLASLSS